MNIVNSNSASSTTQTSTPVVKPAVKPVVKSGYTLDDVAKHASASSCWTAVYGDVYDVTSWINQHPGGKRAILSMCGTDGTNSFDNQHGGQRRANAELASFKIGALSN